MLINLILTLALIRSVLPDCGCNKPFRESNHHFEQNVQSTCEKQADVAPEIEKVCHDFSYEESIAVDMVFIKGGEFYIGTNKPHFTADHEGPERQVHVKDFFVDKYEVSNEKFRKFVAATNYITEAEKFGDSFLFKTLLSPEMQEEYEDYRVVNALWWYKVHGVSWQKPHGPKSSLKGIRHHPVVHVSWNDAREYCKWAGKRLPTEAEWEVTCRGGRKGKLFPWGNKLKPNDEHWLNIWQGKFPDVNTVEDGFAITCPVDEFRQNDYEVYNIVGNVWEWTADLWQPNSTDFNPDYVKKGGSYLCHKDYCYRYRCAARSHNSADTTSGNLGFRCARDV